MLFVGLLAGQAAQAEAPKTELKSRVVSASILRQGVVLVVREVQVPAGRKTFKLDALPDALDGSFWYGSPDGVVVNDVETKLRFEDGPAVEVRGIPQILQANVGKRIHFFTTAPSYNSQPPVTTEYHAVLVDFPMQAYGGPTFKSDDGYLFNPGQISKLDTRGLTTKTTRQRPVQQIDFQVEASHAGHVDFATLENDAAWTGSYLVTLEDQHTASVVSKAQVAVGGLAFDNTDVQVVSGNPTLPDMVKFDLASGFGSLNAYLKNNQEGYRRYRLVNRDPYTLIASFFNQQNYQNGQSAYVVAGGMGGGGGLAEDQNLAMDESGTVNYNNAPKQPTDTLKVEDLFGFPLGHVTLQPGDRLSRVMFRVPAGYERLYRWKLSHDINTPYRQEQKAMNEVDKVVKVLNKSKQPWPTGTAMVVEKNIPLGQVELRFTPIGKAAELTLGTVNDIPTHESVRELSRKTTVIRNTGVTEITSEATLTVENTRSEDLPFEITYQLSGLVQDRGDGQLEQLSAMLDGFNPESLLTWTFDLKPGQVKTIVVRFTTNV
jgi:hypothetical protein